MRVVQIGYRPIRVIAKRRAAIRWGQSNGHCRAARRRGLVVAALRVVAHRQGKDPQWSAVKQAAVDRTPLKKDKMKQ